MNPISILTFEVGKDEQKHIKKRSGNAKVRKYNEITSKVLMALTQRLGK